MTLWSNIFSLFGRISGSVNGYSLDALYQKLKKKRWKGLLLFLFPSMVIISFSLLHVLARVLEYDLMMSVPMHFVVKYLVFWILPSQSFDLL